MVVADITPRPPWVSEAGSKEFDRIESRPEFRCGSLLATAAVVGGSSLCRVGISRSE